MNIDIKTGVFLMVVIAAAVFIGSTLSYKYDDVCKAAKANKLPVGNE